MNLCIRFLSFLIVALGQPAWVSTIAPLSACLGYALFWKSIEKIISFRLKFWISVGWYAAVQAVQLSWMTAIEYQGFYILFVYLSLLFILGLQFGWLSHLVLKRANLTLFQCGLLASVWTLLEWGRLFIFCGFSWNPAGLALTAFLPSLQLASLFGVLGLSFWVLFSNLLLFSSLKMIREKRKFIISINYYLIAILIPYIFGFFQLTYYESGVKNTLSVALVQTNLLPTQKILIKEKIFDYVTPFNQWGRIITALAKIKEAKVDIIAFPEAALPYLANDPIFSLQEVKALFKKEFGDRVEYCFPLSLNSKVSNLFLAQTIANLYQAELIIGLDDREEALNENYQAAFYLSPNNAPTQSYKKNILLPLAEYIPFKWLHVFTKHYGIKEFYTSGKEVKIYGKKIPVALSICYEDTFSHFIRQGRVKGAKLFINITNDNWYPNSQLARQHFDHAKLRCVENGVPFIRACNIGVTAAMDSFGRVVNQKLAKGAYLGRKSDLILATLPLFTYPTLYTQWGDGGIVATSLFFIIVFFLKKIPLKNLAEKCLKVLNF